MTEQSPVPDSGEIAEVLALADQLRESPELDSAAGLLAERSRGRAWLGEIPVAQEAVVDSLRYWLRQFPSGSDSPIQFVATAIEPPSATLAFHSVFPRAESHPQSAGEPDPRQPLYPGVGTAVWRYEGMRAHPDVAPPSPAAAARVRALAVPVWPHIPAIYQRAAELGELPLSDLLGVLVHPPAPTAGHSRWWPDVWIRAVQVMACLGIAHHRVDQPWLKSQRYTVLLALANGPEDWVTEAAAFAMVASAWTDPQLRKDVGTAVGFRWAMAAEANETRAVSILESLTELVLACPWLGDDVLGVARARLTQLRQAEPESLSAERAAELEAIARSHAYREPS